MVPGPDSGYGFGSLFVAISDQLVGSGRLEANMASRLAHIKPAQGRLGAFLGSDLLTGSSVRPL